MFCSAAVNTSFSCEGLKLSLECENVAKQEGFFHAARGKCIHLSLILNGLLAIALFNLGLNQTTSQCDAY